MLRSVLIAAVRQQGGQAAALPAAAAASRWAAAGAASCQMRGLFGGLAPTDLSTVLGSGGVEPHSPAFKANRAAMDELIARLDEGERVAGCLWSLKAVCKGPGWACMHVVCAFVVQLTDCQPSRSMCCRHSARAGGGRPQGGAAAPPARQAAAQARSLCANACHRCSGALPGRSALWSTLLTGA